MIMIMIRTKSDENDYCERDVSIVMSYQSVLQMDSFTSHHDDDDDDDYVHDFD